MSDALDRVKTALADRYAIEREIGSGGMATVYLAHDLKHGRRVAIKVLRPDLAAVLGGERFLREISIAAKLNHPHILALYDSGEADGVIYYVMPHVEGESLRDKLNREEQLSIDDAVALTGQVAAALDYAHQQGVIHRDIKPENILLHRGMAVVADFGIALAVTAAGGERLTETGLSLGTPHYMSPEQATGSTTLDRRTDVYALGAVLYEMLTGEPPHTGPSVQAILAKLLTQPPVQPRVVRQTVPEAVDRAVMTALAKVPADRFRSAGRLAAALVDEIGEQRDTLRSGPVPTHDTVSSRAGSTPRSSRKSRARVAVAGVIGSVLVVAGWLSLHPGGTAEPPSGRVAVLPLENGTGDPSLVAVGKIAADWITEGLVRTGFVQVVDQSTTMRLAGGLQDSAFAEELLAIAEVFVSGIYYRQGDELIFQARISNRSGTLLEALPSIRGPADDPMTVVAVLQERVLSSLAVHFDPRLEHFEGFGGAPPRYPAYRAYVEGLELYMEDAYAEAARAFSRAATLDTAFHRARVWNAGALFVSATAPGVMDSLERVIKLGTSRLSGYDLHHARYFRALGDPIDLREAERQAQAMMEAAPGSEDAVREAALSARRVGQYEKALELFGRLDPERGLIALWPSYWYNVSRTHLDNQNATAALAAAEEGIRRHGRYAPGFLPLAVVEIEALLALGRTEEAQSLIDQAPIDGLPGLYLLLKAAMRAGVLGNEELEEALLGRIAERTDLLEPATGEPLYRRWAKAWLLYYVGQFDEAAAVLALPGSGSGEEESTTASTGRLSRVLTLQGILAAQRGDTADTRRILGRLAELGGDGAALGRARIYGLLGEDAAARRALGAPGAAEFEPSSPSVYVLPELRRVLDTGRAVPHQRRDKASSSIAKTRPERYATMSR